jgi:hypothetical protein
MKRVDGNSPLNVFGQMLTFIRNKASLTVDHLGALVYLSPSQLPPLLRHPLLRHHPQDPTEAGRSFRPGERPACHYIPGRSHRLINCPRGLGLRAP